MLSHHLCPQASYHHPNPHTDNRKRLMPSQLYFLYNCLVVQGSFKFSQRLPDMPLQSASLRAHKPSWTSSLQTTAPSHCISSLPKELEGQKATAGSSDSGFSTLMTGSGREIGQESAAGLAEGSRPMNREAEDHQLYKWLLVPWNQVQELSSQSQRTGAWRCDKEKTLTWLYSQLLSYVSRSWWPRPNGKNISWKYEFFTG